MRVLTAKIYLDAAVAAGSRNVKEHDTRANNLFGDKCPELSETMPT
jgi:hypothetical protein